MVKQKDVLDLVLDCASLIGIHKRSLEDVDLDIHPDLIRHVAVIGAPIDEHGDLLETDALTVYHTIEELAKAGFIFDTDMSWRFYDLENEENKHQRPKFQSGPVFVHKNFIQDEPRPADLVIAAGLKPPEFISTQSYGAAEARDAFTRGVSSEESFRQIVQTVEKSGASIVAARDSGVRSRDLLSANTPAIFVHPPTPRDGDHLPRDPFLDLCFRPEFIEDYLTFEQSFGGDILNRNNLLTQRVLTKYQAQDWRPEA